MESEAKHGMKSRNFLVRIYFKNLYTTVLSHVRPDDSPVLDAGCGEGYLLAMLEEKATPTVGMDISLSKLMTAKKNIRSSSLLLASCQNIPLRLGSFRTVTSVGVLEHVDDHPKALREIREALKPQGKLLVTFPFEEIHAALKTLMFRSKHSSVLHTFDLRFTEGMLDKLGFKVMKKFLFPTFLPLIHASFGFNCMKTEPLNTVSALLQSDRESLQQH